MRKLKKRIETLRSYLATRLTLMWKHFTMMPHLHTTLSSIQKVERNMTGTCKIIFRWPAISDGTTELKKEMRKKKRNKHEEGEEMSLGKNSTKRKMKVAQDRSRRRESRREKISESLLRFQQRSLSWEFKREWCLSETLSVRSATVIEPLMAVRLLHACLAKEQGSGRTHCLDMRQTA